MTTATMPDLPAELLQAAQAGAPEAQFALAQWLVRQVQPEPALDWYRKASTQGHVPAMLEAARILLFLVQNPEALPEGVNLLHRADALGSAAAPYLLAQIALGDRIVRRDFERIGHWVLRSAKRGHPQALRALALFFGRSPVAADQHRALDLYSQAAQRGDPVSALLLEERLRRGEGTAADPGPAEALASELRAAGFEPLPSITAPAAAIDASAPASALDFARLLDTPPASELHPRPRVRLHEGVLTVDECRFVVAMGRPHLRRSQIVDQAQGSGLELEVRTSSDASFDMLVDDFSLRLLQLRLCALAGAELVQAENLIVLRYQPGERYLPHRDYLPPSAIDHAGQRRGTVCCYLNQPPGGGATEFPLLGIRAEPAVGRALVFDNLHADGSPDPDSQHAGLPVDSGEKWLATLWIRQGALRPW